MAFHGRICWGSATIFSIAVVGCSRMTPLLAAPDPLVRVVIVCVGQLPGITQFSPAGGVSSAMAAVVDFRRSS
ncbi:hypothetical protein F5Y15DRAFT_391846 [Xylariaceae sp. FL0016]|nr:hypothetical protein F5Y15DRAFT_391846 [Xylariaceae sp. FL0016]